MEMGNQNVPPVKPELERNFINFLRDTVGSPLSSYGWFILFCCILLYVLRQKFSFNIRSLLPTARTAPADPDEVVRRQEAVAAARLKMQKELDAQAERYKEKQRQLEEEKRRQKIESWESTKEGKSYKLTSPISQPQEPSASTSASSSAPKPKPDRRPLRSGGYNPLTGAGGGACAWRPGRRGPSAGG